MLAAAGEAFRAGRFADADRLLAAAADSPAAWLARRLAAARREGPRGSARDGPPSFGMAAGHGLADAEPAGLPAAARLLVGVADAVAMMEDGRDAVAVLDAALAAFAEAAGDDAETEALDAGAEGRIVLYPRHIGAHARIVRAVAAGGAPGPADGCGEEDVASADDCFGRTFVSWTARDRACPVRVARGLARYLDAVRTRSVAAAEAAVDALPLLPACQYALAYLTWRDEAQGERARRLLTACAENGTYRPAEARNLLGCLLLAEGHVPQAIDSFRHALATSFETPSALFNATLAYRRAKHGEMERGLLDLVLEHARAVPDAFPLDARIYLLERSAVLHLALERRESTSRAVALLRTALAAVRTANGGQVGEAQLGAHELRLTRALVFALLQLGHFADALHAADQLRDDDVVLLIYRADALFCLERAADALVVLHRAEHALGEEDGKRARRSELPAHVDPHAGLRLAHVRTQLRQLVRANRGVALIVLGRRAEAMATWDNGTLLMQYNRTLEALGEGKSSLRERTKAAVAWLGARGCDVDLSAAAMVRAAEKHAAAALPLLDCSQAVVRAVHRAETAGSVAQLDDAEQPLEPLAVLLDAECYALLADRRRAQQEKKHRLASSAAPHASVRT